MDIHTYEPGILSDGALLRWWATMGAAGDIEPTFGVVGCALTGFVKAMAGCTIFYTDDGTEWDRVAWHRPFHGQAGMYGLWLRADLRHYASSYHFLRYTLANALTCYPVVVALTREPRVDRQLSKLGFEGGLFIPQLLDGPHDGAFISWITPAAFETTARAKGAA